MLVPPLHAIGDRHLCRDLAGAVLAAGAGLPAGSVAFHLREKDLGGAELLALARALRAACDASGQRLLVNDRLDVALACGADGVHLPAAGVPPAEARRLLGRERLVGVSCHGVADVIRALAAGADYATFGPVFATPSKQRYGPPVGLAALREASRLGLPLVALGGVELTTARAAWEAGAAGLGAIRAWLAASEPGAALRGLLATRPA